MSFSQFLPRRLSAAGCKAAGTQLAAHLSRWEADGGSLPAEVLAAASRVAEPTQAISLLSREDVAMVEIDRAVDAVVAAFHDALEGRERFLARPDIFAPSLALIERVEAAAELRRQLFPNGVAAIIHAPYHIQWALLDAIKRALSTPECVARLGRVGLAEEAAHLIGWSELYGVRLGITSAEPAAVDPVAREVVRWHEAFGEFFVEVQRAFRDDESPEHLKARQFLLTPYLAQAERERERERALQTRRKAEDGADT
jgi:hypothetical protein